MPISAHSVSSALWNSNFSKLPRYAPIVLAASSAIPAFDDPAGITPPRYCRIIVSVRLARLPSPLARSALYPRDQRVVAEVAVLPERNLAQQEVAQRVGADHLPDRLRPHDVAARLRHLDAVLEKPAVREELLRQRQLRRHQKRRPVDRVEPQNLLADQVQVGRPQPSSFTAVM